MRNHTIRYPDPLWDDAQAAAEKRGFSFNSHLIRCGEELVADRHWQERALAAEAEVRRLTEQIEQGER